MEADKNLQSTLPLLTTPLFQPQYSLTREESLKCSYERARAISKHYKLTVDDIHSLTPKFWDMNRDGIVTRDAGTYILLATQYNLAAGTIAQFSHERTDLQELLQKIMDFEVSALFMITELNHGVDVKYLETTATLQPDGSFILHTPNMGAAKFMPPSRQVAGIPRIVVVMARLMVDGDDRGIRPFIVALSNGKEICKGVTSVLLPELGTRTLDHCLTSFNQVRLLPNALLGDISKPEDFQAHFLSAIRRISIGTISLCLSIIPYLKNLVYIVGKYNLRRTVTGPGKIPIPIINFRSQQIPILHAIAQIRVMEAFADYAITCFMNSTSTQGRQRLATILKASFIHNMEQCSASLPQRCGAQGMFKHNQICEYNVSNSMPLGGLINTERVLNENTRISSIYSLLPKETMPLFVLVGFAIDLFLGRYNPPESTNPNSLLAQHEAGLATECMKVVESQPLEKIKHDFNRNLNPHCKPIVEAIGHRMAYDAAIAAGVNQDLVALYEVGVVKEDLSWYVEFAGLKRGRVLEMEHQALDAVLPRLNELLDELDIGAYCTAPIVSQTEWGKFMCELKGDTGNAKYELFNHTKGMKKDVLEKGKVSMKWRWLNWLI
ncbi:uncharacterized protein N7473_004289 [Penicillium subrubescens]|uniref:uncharacterized protein n=1 Tax=Penicillium subrubescens TaxID=1316194 RepID=UPI00254561E1|nr:uncharacterized protein N7473_004289 [Penicillium subrubescens]KAJ5900219.1 hypothetical protein N7473_004289 [Penicillium subrubescens]